MYKRQHIDRTFPVGIGKHFEHHQFTLVEGAFRVAVGVSKGDCHVFGDRVAQSFRYLHAGAAYGFFVQDVYKRQILILVAVVLIGFASCADSKQSMTITVTNPLALERVGEMVEVPMGDVVAKLKLADTAQIVVLDVCLLYTSRCV